MDKYIELIDKYRIEQGDGDYNPPSYAWVDNTGEIVRCRECRWGAICLTGQFLGLDGFCSKGEREVQDG